MRKLSALAAAAGLGLVARVGVASAAAPPIWSSAPPIASAVTAQGVLYQPTPPATAHMPTGSSIFSTDVVDASGRTVRQVAVSYSSSADISDWTKATGGSLISLDGGRTFTPAPAFGILAPTSDGHLLDIGAVSGFATPTQANLLVRRSTDGGRTWSARQTAPLQLPAANLAGHGLYPAGRAVTTNDGTGRHVILFPYYARLTGDTNGWRVAIARSYDDGASWTTAGTVATPRAVAGGYNSYTETAVSYLPNGRLYAVMRVDLLSAGAARDFHQNPMEYALSADDGATWTPTRQVTAPAAGSLRPVSWPGVDPGLTLLPNGIMVLVAGRPDNSVAVSRSTLTDGSPRWINKTTYYANYPTDVRLRGSSGYQGVTPIGSDSALLVNDNCGPDPWGCPSTSSGWTHDNKQRILKWSLKATAGAGGTIGQTANGATGRLDLNAMLRSGRAALTRNDFTATDRRHPTLRAYGAFDGSADYWSSALATTGRAATLTLRLDRIRPLAEVGLSLQPGLSGRAELRYSRDGTHWASAGRFRQSGRHSLQYYPMPAGAAARYVQLVVQPSRVTARGIRSGGAMVNELELYSGVRTAVSR